MIKKLHQWRTDRRLKRTLKLYAKELSSHRAAYADTFLKSETLQSGYDHFYSGRLIPLRRILAVTCVIILIMAFSVIAAVGNEVKLFDFLFKNNDTHTSIDVPTSKSNDDVKYYIPSYIPDGYTLDGVENEGYRHYYYIKNEENEEIIHILEYSDSLDISQNNEKCTITDERIGEYAVRIYRYDDGTLTCYFQIGETHFSIACKLPLSELRHVINGLVTD